MRYFWLILFFLMSSLPALALEMPPQSVQEPEASDEEEYLNIPEEPLPPEPIPEKSPESSKPVAAPSEEAGDSGYSKVMLQGLNKVTAHAVAIEAPLGSVVRFGTIEIVAHSCWKSAPDERPENAALLEVFEIKQGEAPKQIFLGWMFSSSPGLSSLEHPFYDVTVVRCEKAEPPVPAPEKTDKKEAKKGSGKEKKPSR